MIAFVTGVTGQDGHHMARLLLSKGIEVVGLTRDVTRATAAFTDPAFEGLKLEPLDYAEPGAFGRLFRQYRPEQVYNFAAKATGVGMFDAPAEMTRLNGTFVLDILEAIRHDAQPSRTSFCQASSSEMFGDVQVSPQDETTAFRPRSPYGAAKLFAHNMLGVYRSAFGIRASSAILYNHESWRRSTQFVTRKIANGAARISLGLDSVLKLGPLDITRDWGYAPEYVDAMRLMALAEQPTDYVVSTGKLNTIRHLCAIAFGHLGLDYKAHVQGNAADTRISHSVNLHGNPSKIRNDLGWSAQRSIDDIMIEMVEHDLSLLGKANSSR
jgi:GDPmannose 4,6-dehydratase